APALAQTYPTRPMTMVVPFAAGGAVDVLARALAARAAKILGQQIVIENVGGAGGMIGSNRVAKAAPDGYQFVLGSVGTHAQNQSLYKNPVYNVMRDFEPMILIGETPLLLVSRKDFPANGLQEFIAHAKKHPGELKFGSAGVGSAIHLGCVLFNAAAGVTASHIPYRGGAPAMQDLIAGRIDYSCNIITSAYPQVRDQAIKAPALLGAKRAALLPNLATAQEQGMTGFDAGS
ncbi:MAG: tripartite tricarboxylate transporter substrate binding protein BugD, partial [Alphaproteobacteria bacterium]|nr:tripartite tricarboxylate transporter substrate binding protein BugD [Alphaproteobacteria bacterium]